jgi:hypothetical protein
MRLNACGSPATANAAKHHGRPRRHGPVSRSRNLDAQTGDAQIQQPHGCYARDQREKQPPPRTQSVPDVFCRASAGRYCTDVSHQPLPLRCELDAVHHAQVALARPSRTSRQSTPRACRRRPSAAHAQHGTAAACPWHSGSRCADRIEQALRRRPPKASTQDQYEEHVTGLMDCITGVRFSQRLLSEPCRSRDLQSRPRHGRSPRRATPGHRFDRPARAMANGAAATGRLAAVLPCRSSTK